MALVRLVAGFVLVLATLLLPAGTIAYWQAWMYTGVLFVPVTLVFGYLLAKDPALLERRMRTTERSAERRRLLTLAPVWFLLAFVLPGLDRRFGWSHVPVPVVIAADVLVLLGYGLFVLVLRENSYASRVVEVEEGQPVITTGPYAIVRHPMYLAVLVMFLASPLALGSWWAVISTLPIVALFVGRIENEERLLARELGGYRAYAETTRYRLVPGVW